MKKTVLILSALFCISAIGNAQNTFKEGDKVVNLGIGLGNVLYTGSYYTSKTPPLSASFEMGIKDNLFDENSSLGVGGYIGYCSAKWEYSGWGTTYGWKYKNIIVGVRGIVHYQLLDKCDTYGGILLGYDIVSSKEFGNFPGANTYTATSSGVAWSCFVGGRYYFTDKIAAMAELGYGIAYLNLGVSFKF